MKYQFKGKNYDSKEEMDEALNRFQKELQEKKLRQQAIEKGELDLKWLRFQNSFWGKAILIATGLGALAGFISLIFWIIEKYS